MRLEMVTGMKIGIESQKFQAAFQMNRCSVLQCVAVCCSVLQCVAVCCSARSTHSNEPFEKRHRMITQDSDFHSEKYLDSNFFGNGWSLRPCVYFSIYLRLRLCLYPSPSSSPSLFPFPCTCPCYQCNLCCCCSHCCNLCC